MSTVHERKQVVVTMTPDDLRRLADEMEEKYPTLSIGDSTFVSCIGVNQNQNLIVNLHLDPEWFTNREQTQQL